jgi:hypothetical protein
MAVNVPVNTGGVFVAAGSSVTGSFGGMLALSGSGAQVTGMKYINGYNVSNPGFNPTYSLAESATPQSFGVAAGSKLELMITSCSLAAGGSPAFFYY